MLRRCAVLGACVAVGLVMGCCKKATQHYVEMERPLSFGSSFPLKSFKGFLPGKWGLKQVMDKNLAKQLGLEALTRQPEPKGFESIYTFTEDGKFTCVRAKFGHSIAGHWQENGETVMLVYDTLDGKPFQQRLGEIRTSAESGRPSALADDIFVDWANSTLNGLVNFRLSNNRCFLLAEGSGLPDMGNGPGRSAKVDMGDALIRLTAVND